MSLTGHRNCRAPPKILHLTVSRQGTSFAWPIRLPGADGRLDSWNESAHAAARMAVSQWIRLESNREAGAYDVVVPVAPLPDPVWPTESFESLLDLAFRGRRIDTMDHPFLRKLRGEV